MPIGDSITQGAEIHYADGSYGIIKSYRDRLWDTAVLTYGAVAVDMVGPNDFAWENDQHHIYADPADPDRNHHDDEADHVPHPIGDPDFIGTVYSRSDFDIDHFAQAGWRADRVLELLPSQDSPDIAIIYLGLNDIRLGQSGDAAAAEVGQIISALQADNTDIKILAGLLSPIGRSVEVNPEIGEFNTALSALVPSLNTPTSQVVTVDHWTPYITSDGGTPGDYADDVVNTFALGLTTLDGIHPNTLAESIMADRWWPALNGFISDVQDDADDRFGALSLFGEPIRADFSNPEPQTTAPNPFTTGDVFAGHMGASLVIGSSPAVRAQAVPEPNGLILPLMLSLSVCRCFFPSCRKQARN